MQREAFSFKVVLLGNAGVGKSCMVMRYIRDEFIDDNETTIGAAFMTKTITLEDCTVRTEIWDTAGQERYRALAPMYYRGAQAAIVVYDITNRESFDGAKMWIKELQRRADANMVIALAGNKTDLSNKRTVDFEEAAAYAKELGLLHIETSAKDASNIEQLFADVAYKVSRSATSRASRGDLVALAPSAAVAAPAPAGPPPSGGCC